MSSIPWNGASKDDNDIGSLILTQEKNSRCIAILTSKIMIASLKYSPKYPEKNVQVLSLGRFNWEIYISNVSWKILFCTNIIVPVV